MTIGFVQLVRQKTSTLASTHGAAVSPIEIARRGLRMSPDSTDEEVRAALTAIGRGVLAAAKPTLTQEQIAIAKSCGLTSAAELDAYAERLSVHAAAAKRVGR